MNAIFVHIPTNSYHAKLLYTNILIGYDNTFDSFIVSNLGISIIYYFVGINNCKQTKPSFDLAWVS